MSGDGAGKANVRQSSDILKRRGVLLAAARMHWMELCQLRPNPRAGPVTEALQRERERENLLIVKHSPVTEKQ
jgi:hypothetical protein